MESCFTSKKDAWLSIQQTVFHTIEGQDYIVDFICRPLKLIIEIDGYSHQFKVEEDQLRDENFKRNQYVVLRFSEYEVKYQLQNVIAAIEQKVLQSPSPLLQGG